VPRPQRTPDEIEEMRRRILQVAHELIHEGGPAHLTMRRIAERLGVSHMTLYGYFSSRQEMLSALQEAHFARIQARQSEQQGRAEAGDVLGAIRDELGIYQMLARRRPEMYQVMLGAGPGHEGMPCQRMSRLHSHVGFLAGLIRVGIAQGVLAPRDETQAALVIISMVNGPLLVRAIGFLPDETIADAIWDEVLQQALAYLKTARDASSGDDARPLTSELSLD
jgi:AcrR family transcriptional regulator